MKTNFKLLRNFCSVKHLSKYLIDKLSGSIPFIFVPHIQTPRYNLNPAFTIKLFVCCFFLMAHTNSMCQWINEIHYDNNGTDINECIEIAGPAGTDMSCYSIILYNGNGGSSYDTDVLSGILPDEGCGYGAISFCYSTNGIQNGAPDGIVLYNNCTASVVQFLSYEGSFAATNDVANGMMSTDIGVFESSSTPVGSSMQLIGVGSNYGSFTWVSAGNTASMGILNTGQDISLSIDAGADLSLCAGDQTTLTASIVSGVTYTMDVTATSSTDYTFSGDFSGLDPDITAEVGDTLIFNVNSPSHPFWIKTAPTTGTGNAVSVANNGTGSGTISWIPTAPGTYYYICEFHSGMWATITINPSSTTVSWNNGVSDGVPFTPTVEGYYVVTATNGSCVVTDSLYLSIGQPTSSSFSQTRCDSYTAPDGTTYTTSGIYTAIIPNLAGCDSTITIDLTILYSSVSSITTAKCDSYTAPDGQIYTSSGSYIAIILNAAGCDSIIAIDLTIDYGTSSFISETKCDSYTAPDGAVYTTSGIYTAIIANASNCDSTITIDLTISSSSFATIAETACGTYTAPDGASYSSSGIYTAVIPNAANCDSTITIDLTVNAGTTGSTTETVCDSYTSPDGTVYTTTGIYTAVIPNASGCDSTITIDLTVNGTANSITQTACDSYTAPDGAIYTISGIYTAILTNAAGCDSTITIDLTVGNTSMTSATVMACDTYTAPDGSVYTSDGIYTATIPNSSGCDSTITIDLTVNSTSTGSATEIVCDSYTAPDGAVYTSSGVYTAVIPNAANCDSTIMIDLTVNSSSTGTATEIVCDTYTAPDGAVYTSTGMYTAVMPNAVGCDSTITIDLTVNNSTASSISETALDSYTAPSGAVYTTSGVFHDTIANAAGCDSIITIDLTMNFTGIEEHSDAHIILSPNPTSDLINIEGIENVVEIKSMELVSSLGRVVAVLMVGTKKIDVSTLSSGTYFLSITHAEGTERLRFVKE